MSWSSSQSINNTTRSILYYDYHSFFSLSDIVARQRHSTFNVVGTHRDFFCLISQMKVLQIVLIPSNTFFMCSFDKGVLFQEIQNISHPFPRSFSWDQFWSCLLIPIIMDYFSSPGAEKESVEDLVCDWVENIVIYH